VHGPGMSFKRLLQSASDENVLKFLDSTVRELSELIEPDLLEGDRLRAIVGRLISTDAVVDDPSLSALVVTLLPPDKRIELAARLDLKGDSQPETLKDAVRTPAGKRQLKAFLGFDANASLPSAVPPTSEYVVPNYGLFTHQRRLAKRAAEVLARRPNKVLLHLPTGGGKTRTAMHLVCQHLRDVGPTLVVWLANSRELLDQAAEEFQRAWQSLGDRTVSICRMWGSHQGEPLEQQDGVVFASLQKLHFFKNRDLNEFLKLADRASLTVIDEAHIALAPTYRSVVFGLADKRLHNRLIGLTATPGRSWDDIQEDQELADLFEREKVTLEVDGYPDPVSYLIDEGYLAQPKFCLLNASPGLKLTEEDNSALASQLEIPERVLKELGDDPTRNLRILQEAEELLTRHRRVLVFCPSVASARNVAALLEVRGHKAACVTGESTDSDRRRAITNFRSDAPEPMVLCNYGVLTTGFDAPRTSAALIARPTLSLVLYSQMVGRATRGIKAGGNREAEIVTVVDPSLPGFGKIEEAFRNWEDVWYE